MANVRWMLVAAATLAGGCTVIAGLNGDYEVGDVNQGGSASGGSATGAGTTSGGTTSTGGNTGATGGTISTGGTIVVGGSGGSGGVVVQGGSGGTPTLPVVPCGPGVTCAPGQVCCVENGFGNDINGCAAPGACGAGDFEAECDGPEDCQANEDCCAVWNNYYSQVGCASSCNDVTFCGGPGAPNQQHCSGNDNCNPSNALPGYFVCF